MAQDILFNYYKTHKKRDIELLICSDDKEAKELEAVAKFFNDKAIVFPDFRASFGDDLRVYTQELNALFNGLRDYYRADKKPLIISPLKTLLFKLPKKELLGSFKIDFGDRLNLDELKDRLFYWGYSFVDIIESMGEVSFRGDIIDIYPPSSKEPFRISLFDNEVEQIKNFEVATQKTTPDELDSIEVCSAYFSLDESEFNSLNARVESSLHDSLSKDIASLGFWHLDEWSEDFLATKKAVLVKNLDSLLIDAYALNGPTISREAFNLEVLEADEDVKELVLSDIKTLLSLHKNKKITIIAANEAIIKQAGIFDTSTYNIVSGGYVLNIITKDELIISLNKKQKPRRRRKSSILLDDLKVGDYVVHEEYGVGVFGGIQKTEILGGVKDFIIINYMGEDKLLLPVENLEYIDRYIAGGGAVPVIDRLGKGSFAKLKEKVKAKLFEIASQLLGVAAQRALLEAPKMSIDEQELKSFQALAGFEYTEDQVKTIDEIVTELRSGNVMDRLLSGDVGFGKTEVAMNSIYMSYKNGFQSALIVPTTLLSSQHFKTLEARLTCLGLRVARVDRFVSSKDKNITLKGLASGEIDVVVGTHVLFDIGFKNLGLVIVDEEHKFGVKQKERIKELYSKTHILSMSATPIPRSLNQALSSIKTMSNLLTPPSERIGVRTFVKEYDANLIKEVILRELRRGGQLFYIHNSIDHMNIKLGELKALLPDLRVMMLHSKVGASESEKELLKFEAGEYDVMLSTTIVESGIHMPRVNTIIIDGANRFGIADLHQLRGRVGRGSVEGFAYFIVEDKEQLSQEAKKRLLALESNSYLGSGSALAYHDLEIRGGGNLVGDAQSGHIKNIGYSLYLKMLEDAIKELSNTKEKKSSKVDIKLTISAFISDEVIAEDRLRLDFYKRLSHAKTSSEVYELQDEMIDRFGGLDTPTKQFFELVVIKILAIDKKIKTISNYAQNITIVYEDETKQSLKSASKDDEDIIKTVLEFLR